MNEKIKELADQATEVSEPLSGNLCPDTPDLAKFAELIIRECAITVTDRCEMRNESDVKRAEYYARRIKEHFGIEE